MPQDRETGAAGAAYGHRMGRGLAKLLGAVKPSTASNEVSWNGRRAVIKSCRAGTNSFGVTSAMLPRLDCILAAFEDGQGQVQVYELDAPKFRAAMYDSRSAAAAGKVKLVTKAYARSEGQPRERFSVAEVDRAAG